MFGRLLKVQGNKVEIELDDEFDFNKVERFANGKQPVVELNVNDGRTITPDQRKKIWALLNDFCRYTGYSLDEAEILFKSLTRSKYNIEPFSLSDCSVTTGCLMIEAILEFLFDNDIPFQTKTWDSIPDWFPKQMLCIKNKRCVICGKPADIAHYDTVGMGRNRNNINHVGMRIMTLCRIHHDEQHHCMRYGKEIDFYKKYHIKPIKVTKEIAKELHLGVVNDETT